MTGQESVRSAAGVKGPYELRLTRPSVDLVRGLALTGGIERSGLACCHCQCISMEGDFL